jgi:branched-chain amino acid transport system ATP-binding protein
MLSLAGVHVSLAGVAVLRDVSFELDPEHTTLIVGRNGAGKTTTLRAIMGVLAPERGQIMLDGENIAKMPAYRRADMGIGYAPEDRRMIPNFSVEENLLVGAYALRLPTGARRKKLDEIYELLPEVAEFRKRSGGNLSGGQSKMVALGRALVTGTRFVLLDEPFQGLAPALALEYARALARVREGRGDLSILVTESSPDYMKGLTDKTLRIERGEIALQSYIASRNV